MQYHQPFPFPLSIRHLPLLHVRCMPVKPPADQSSCNGVYGGLVERVAQLVSSGLKSWLHTLDIAECVWGQFRRYCGGLTAAIF